MKLLGLMIGVNNQMVSKLTLKRTKSAFRYLILVKTQ